ncbi:TonB-dependent receptor [Thiohalobacter sp.]|uniref:TonB-dependent receptor n=1 Tax=Thiohalobacter sp. TaxID=2025948 RepID=UPI002618324F|nr:TonB-dependent receptor [Thiohalobacter sp.]
MRACSPRVPGLGLGASLLLGAFCAQAEPAASPATPDTLYIEILKPLPTAPVEVHRIRRSEPALPESAPDAAALLRSLPGADVNRNGPLTGIAQYRGLFGDRVAVRIDGMPIASGGPNAMDPPLGLVPQGQVQSITLYRGIAPVSMAAESLGGLLAARSIDSHFIDAEAATSSGLVRADADSAANGRALNLFTALANRSQRVHVGLTRERGKDLVTPLGRLRSTQYDRDQLRLGYGWRGEGMELSLDGRRNETGPTGTPALPMDIVYADTNSGRGEIKLDTASGRVRAEVHGNRVWHRMNNYSLRPPLNPATLRVADAESSGHGGSLAWQPHGSRWRFGLDADREIHDAVIRDPANPSFRVDNFHDVRLTRLGLYAERDAQAAGAHWNLGVRLTRSRTDAGEVRHSMAMMNANIMTLQTRFNSADRSRSDLLFDLVLGVDRPLRPGATLIVALGHKMRTPSYQERYLWLPLQSTGGLADGNNYVGDPALDPERSWQLELGIELEGRGWHFSPRLFYRRIDDYIQAVPVTDPVVIAVSSLGGDSTPLAFANVEARLYGLDALGGWQLAPAWRLEGDFTWVRGDRRDIDDALYRVSPLRLGLRLLHRRGAWQFRIGARAHARQDRVSRTLGELPTPGHVTLGAGVRYRLGQGGELDLALENLTDRLYYDHLGGYNRVTGSAVPLGSRLPGAGRNLQLKLSWRW